MEQVNSKGRKHFKERRFLYRRLREEKGNSPMGQLREGGKWDSMTRRQSPAGERSRTPVSSVQNGHRGVRKAPVLFCDVIRSRVLETGKKGYACVRHTGWACWVVVWPPRQGE